MMMAMYGAMKCMLDGQGELTSASVQGSTWYTWCAGLWMMCSVESSPECAGAESCGSA